MIVYLSVIISTVWLENEPKTSGGEFAL